MDRYDNSSVSGYEWVFRAEEFLVQGIFEGEVQPNLIVRAISHSSTIVGSLCV